MLSEVEVSVDVKVLKGVEIVSVIQSRKFQEECDH